MAYQLYVNVRLQVCHMILCYFFKKVTQVAAKNYLRAAIRRIKLQPLAILITMGWQQSGSSATVF